MRITEEQYAEMMRDRRVSQKKTESQPVEELSSVKPIPAQKESKQPNKTEAEYGRLLRLEFVAEPRYEAITFKLRNSHRYTPDYIIEQNNGNLLCVEVKNANYKHASYGRSKMAFAQCKIDFPMFDYRWAEKTKEGWKIS